MLSRPSLKSKSPPRYFYVMDDVICKIRSGLYRPGMKLDSVRTLAARYCQDRGTVLYALNMLACKSYLYSEPKRGYFVNPNLKPHRSYTIGYFLNGEDPMGKGEVISVLHKGALSRGYRVIAGFNFFDGGTLESFLKNNPVLDGILLDGTVDEKLLSILPPASSFPYMVLGKHDIRPEHPQEERNPEQDFYNALINAFRRFRGKKIAALMGDVHYAEDRECMKGLLRALADSGAVSGPELITSSVMSDGFSQCRRILETHSPDVLFLASSQMGGYRKYMNIFHPAKRPYVLYTHPVLQPGDEKNFDEYLNTGLSRIPNTVSALDRLFRMIDEKAETPGDALLHASPRSCFSITGAAEEDPEAGDHPAFSSAARFPASSRASGMNAQKKKRGGERNMIPLHPHILKQKKYEI